MRPNGFSTRLAFHPKDFRFERTQSRETQVIPWGKRSSPVKSWGRPALWIAGVSFFAVVAVFVF